MNHESNIMTTPDLLESNLYSKGLHTAKYLSTAIDSTFQAPIVLTNKLKSSQALQNKSPSVQWPLFMTTMASGGATNNERRRSDEDIEAMRSLVILLCRPFFLECTIATNTVMLATVANVIATKMITDKETRTLRSFVIM
ncbi:hypothetical protein Bpfe_028813 [Biomphalaria pfeifferi]|uniref:Uncharacterized protein n=1 Tax=Biomphalaria pfeifferi TaxID=112525 RepID=A0AAD8AST4_BIOPF|nr:hypothetical protein Bpfe_028813 [Biomphalaria pfeifferi]